MSSTSRDELLSVAPPAVSAGNQHSLAPLIAWDSGEAPQLSNALGAPAWVSDSFTNLASFATWAAPQLQLLGYEDVRNGISEAGEGQSWGLRGRES